VVFAVETLCLTDRSSIDKVGLCFLISQDTAKAVNVADVRARMEQQGAVPVTIAPEQFDVIIRNDTARNVRILREAGVAAN
jgi:tripartite-type tricarboxylate transporter receptor subunit TctC